MTALRSKPVDLFGYDYDWLASRLPHEVWTDVEDVIKALMTLWEMPEDSDDDDKKVIIAAAQYDAIEAFGRVLGRLLDGAEAT